MNEINTTQAANALMALSTFHTLTESSQGKHVWMIKNSNGYQVKTISSLGIFTNKFLQLFHIQSSDRNLNTLIHALKIDLNADTLQTIPTELLHSAKLGLERIHNKTHKNAFLEFAQKIDRALESTPPASPVNVVKSSATPTPAKESLIKKLSKSGNYTQRDLYSDRVSYAFTDVLGIPSYGNASKNLQSRLTNPEGLICTENKLSKMLAKSTKLDPAQVKEIQALHSNISFLLSLTTGRADLTLKNVLTGNKLHTVMECMIERKELPNAFKANLKNKVNNPDVPLFSS